MDWYEEHVEPEVRDLVRYLRNNGVNTECSCGHEGYIQCWHNIDGSIKELHDLLYNYFAENRAKKSGCEYSDDINDEIDIKLTVRNGHVFSTLNIKLGEK